MMTVRTLTIAATAALLLGACAHEVDFQGEGEGFVGEGSVVHAALETPGVGRHRRPGRRGRPRRLGLGDPGHRQGRLDPGFVAGTDKKSGPYIYGLDARSCSSCRKAC